MRTALLLVCLTLFAMAEDSQEQPHAVLVLTAESFDEVVNNSP